jgi:hypothetical protein
MANSAAKKDASILSALEVRMMSCNSSTLNLPTDDAVIVAVLSDLEGKGLNFLLLKERIKKYERMVQKYLVSSAILCTFSHLSSTDFEAHGRGIDHVLHCLVISGHHRDHDRCQVEAEQH